MAFMNVEESIQNWFKALENQGEYIHMDFWVKDLKTNQVDEYCFSHANMDGIAAINQILKTRGMEAQIDPPTIPKRMIPPQYLQFFLFLKYLVRLPFKSVKWNISKTDWAPNGKSERPLASRFTVLNLADSTTILTKAKEKQVHLNTYLLYYLDQALIPYYERSDKKRVWLIPVSLRSDHMGQYDKNITGFIDGYLVDHKNIQALNSEIKNGLMKGDHFGGHFGIGIGRFIGKTLLNLLVKMNHYTQIRTGVFTNLGSWGEDKEIIDYHWGGLPPVIRSQPVGAVAGRYHGHLHLGFQMHPILSRDPKLAKTIIDRWIQLSLAGS